MKHSFLSSKKELVGQLKIHYLLVGIFLLYFVLRLPNLTLQPIFADEAIYIRWAQIAKAEPNLRFISLQDGKTPLFMWLMAPNLIIFEDPLIAGRLLSVISGFFTLLGIYKLGQRFFNRRVGLIGALLVATTPFMIFFDRMALVDSMLSAFTIWSIYWALRLAEKQTWKDAIILGFLLGGGWLTKTPGQINIVFLCLTVFLFNFKQRSWPKKLVKYFSYFGLSALIAGAIYLFQKIDPNFHQLSARNSDYVHPWSRLLQYPFDPLGVHFLDTLNFSYAFLGLWLFFLPVVAGIVVWGKNKAGWMLLIWALVPIVYELQFIKAYTARYILFSIPILLLLIAWVIDQFWSQKIWRYLMVGLLGLSLIWSAYFSYNLLTNLATTPLGQEERRGYLEDWTAGYGLKEIASYLIAQSRNQTIVVGTEGSFGTLPDGLTIYLDRYFHSQPTQKIIILSDGPKVTDNVRNFSYEKPTFFIANKSRYPLPEDGLQLIKQYPKIAGPDLPQDAIVFYKVNPVSR